MDIIASFAPKFGDIDSERERSLDRMESGDEVDPGIIKSVRVYVASKRKLSVGDKMAGRHGNKGVVAKIVPEEDMPFMEDGSPVDIILNPLGVPSRMNLGQLYETMLGWAGAKLDKHYSTPVFDGASHEDVLKEMKDANIPKTGQVYLYDGKSGEKIEPIPPMAMGCSISSNSQTGVWIIYLS